MSLCAPCGATGTPYLPQVAREGHRVKFLPGPRTGVDPSLQSFLRLSFAHYAPDDLELGVQRLRDAILEAMVRSG